MTSGSNCRLRYLYKKIEAPNIIVALIACDLIDVFTSTFNLVIVHGISIEDDTCQNVRATTKNAPKVWLLPESGLYFWSAPLVLLYQRRGSYIVSSSGGPVSLFNIISFKNMVDNVENFSENKVASVHLLFKVYQSLPSRLTVMYLALTIYKRILTLCNCKEDVKRKGHFVIDKFAERGLQKLIDEQFAQLEELEEADESLNFVEEVLDLYFNDSAKFINLVEQELAKNPVDWVTLEKVLHQLKGSSSRLSASSEPSLVSPKGALLGLSLRCNSWSYDNGFSGTQKLLAFYTTDDSTRGSASNSTLLDTMRGS